MQAILYSGKMELSQPGHRGDRIHAVNAASLCNLSNMELKNAVLDIPLIPCNDLGRLLLLLPTFNRWKCWGSRVLAPVLSWIHLSITALTKCIMTITYAHICFSSWAMRTSKYGTNGSPAIALVDHRGPGSGKCSANPGWISPSTEEGAHIRESAQVPEAGAALVWLLDHCSLPSTKTVIFSLSLPSSALGPTTSSPDEHWEFHLCSQMWIPRQWWRLQQKEMWHQIPVMC